MAGGYAAAAAALQNIPAPPAARVEAPIRLLRQLLCMRDELVESRNWNDAERWVRGMRFDQYEEHVCAVWYKGVPLVNYQKIINDVVSRYKIDDNTKKRLLSAKLCEESQSSMLSFDIEVGKGVFGYGKFMAVNIDGKIDLCFMIFRANFKIDQDVVMDHRQLEDFQNYLRFRVFDMDHRQLEDFQNYLRFPVSDYLFSVCELARKGERTKKFSLQRWFRGKPVLGE